MYKYTTEWYSQQKKLPLQPLTIYYETMLALSSLRMHGILAMAAFVLLSIIALNTIELKASIVQKPQQIADIAIEHKESLSVRISMSMLHGQGILEIGHDGKETIQVSVPDSWERTEVRNTPIDMLKNESPMLGFVRWHFPPETTVTFRMMDAPDNVLIHNPNRVPLKLSYVYVDLETEEILQDIKLIKDESMTLW